MAKVFTQVQCFLCGQPITTKLDRSREHLPARAFIPKPLYSTFHYPTAFTHKACNGGYTKDEEYVAAALMPLGLRSPVGALLENLIVTKHQRQPALIARVVQEFFDHLVSSLTYKTVDRDRATRVIQKLLRSMHFLKRGQILPTTTSFQYVYGTRMDLRTRRYRDAAFRLATDHLAGMTFFGPWPKHAFSAQSQSWTNGVTILHVYAVTLWASLFIIGFVHDPHCCCGSCSRSHVLPTSHQGPKD